MDTHLQWARSHIVQTDAHLDAWCLHMSCLANLCLVRAWHVTFTSATADVLMSLPLFAA